MNGLDFNVLTKEKYFILETINKIDDQEKKKAALARYIVIAKEASTSFEKRVP